MRYFMDTEFIEDGKTIDLISIAIVCEDDRELYLCNAECDLDRANAWVKQNVLPHLPKPPWSLPLIRTTEFLEWVKEECLEEMNTPWGSRASIRKKILEFMPPDSKPEVWGYFADYDWVVFCQLFGKMIDLPKGYPMWCRDLKQLMWHLQIERPPKPDKEHDALADARWNKQVFEQIRKRAVGFTDGRMPPVSLRI